MRAWWGACEVPVRACERDCGRGWAGLQGGKGASAGRYFLVFLCSPLLTCPYPAPDTNCCPAPAPAAPPLPLLPCPCVQDCGGGWGGGARRPRPAHQNWGGDLAAVSQPASQPEGHSGRGTAGVGEALPSFAAAAALHWNVQQHPHNKTLTSMPAHQLTSQPAGLPTHPPALSHPPIRPPTHPIPTPITPAPQVCHPADRRGLPDRPEAQGGGRGGGGREPGIHALPGCAAQRAVPAGGLGWLGWAGWVVLRLRLLLLLWVRCAARGLPPTSPRRAHGVSL